jgi:hypothetical protein
MKQERLDNMGMLGHQHTFQPTQYNRELPDAATSKAMHFDASGTQYWQEGGIFPLGCSTERIHHGRKPPAVHPDGQLSQAAFRPTGLEFGNA